MLLSPLVIGTPFSRYFVDTIILIFVQKPLEGKHHVVVQYMARWMKCPLPPPAWTTPPRLDPPSLCVCRLYKAMHQGRGRQGTSHCSCLAHCFLLQVLGRQH